MKTIKEKNDYVHKPRALQGGGESNNYIGAGRSKAN